MVESTAVTGKICCICGEDCSGKPRIKDSSGNYACKACAAAYSSKQTKPSSQAEPKAPRPQRDTEPVDADVDAALWADLADPTANIASQAEIGEGGLPMCPSCKSSVGSGQTICLTCGKNLSSGKSVRTQITKAAKDKTSASGGGLKMTLMDGGALAGFLIMFIPNAIAYAMALANNELSIAALIIGGIVGFILWIATIAIAFQEGQGLWGWMGVLSIVPVLGWFTSLAFSFYGLFLCPRVGYRAAWWGQLLGAILGAVILGGSIFSQLSSAFDGLGENEAEIDLFAAPQIAVDAARPGEDAWAVNFYLVEQARQAAMRRVNETSQDNAFSIQLERLANSAERIDEFPDEFVQDALERLENLSDRTRKEKFGPYEWDEEGDQLFDDEP